MLLWTKNKSNKNKSKTKAAPRYISGRLSFLIVVAVSALHLPD